MDPFTQRMLERARARQEKIDQKLASSGQSVPKRKPLAENVSNLKSEGSPVKSPTRKSKETVLSPKKSTNDAVVRSPKRTIQKTGSTPVSSPQKGRNDIVVTKKEFMSPRGSKSSRRGSDVSVEINIMHRNDIHIEVEVEERDAPITVYGADSGSSVVIKEIADAPEESKPAIEDMESKPERAGLRQNVKSRLDRLGNLYSDTPNLSSPIHRTEQAFSSATPPLDTPRPAPERKPCGKKFNRLAALADQINNWEDDLTHHNFHPETEKKPSKATAKFEKMEDSTLDVSINSLRDINKVLSTTTKNQKPVNCRTFTKSSNECTRLDKTIVAELEDAGYRRVSAGQSRLVYDFTTTKPERGRQEPKPASTTPSATAAPNMATMVASPPAVTKKPSIKKYKAPTPPQRKSETADCDSEKDKENNVVPQQEANANDTIDCKQTKPADDKASPVVKRLAPKLNGNVDRNSVLSKAAMFEAGSPRAKDPAEMSLRERKALFEKNKGTAIVPKAPFGLAPSVKTLHGDKDKKPALPVKPSTPTKPTAKDEDSISQTSVGGIKGKLAALFNKEQTISETTIANRVKQEREKEMEMLQNRFVFKPSNSEKPENVPDSDDENGDSDRSEKAPLMGSTLSLAQANRKPEIIANIPKVDVKEQKVEDTVVGSQPTKRRSSQDSPVVLSVLEDVKRIKVNNNKKETNGAVLHQPTSIYPHLSDIETDNSHTQEEYSDCGGSSVENIPEKLNKSDNWAETSFGREVMNVVKRNNTSYKKAVQSDSDESGNNSELDDMLDEALDADSEGPTPPKQNKHGNSLSSTSFVYQEAQFKSPLKPPAPSTPATPAARPDRGAELVHSVSFYRRMQSQEAQFKSPLKPPAPSTPATPAARPDRGAELVHSVSFYRRMQSQSSTPTTPMRVIRHSSPEREPPEESTANVTTVRQRIKELHNEIAKQQTVISQASQALNLCASTIEFSGSTEQAEGERLLLLATHRRQACLHEVQRLQVEGAGEAATAGMASLHIHGLNVPLRRDYIRQLNADGAVGHHSVCLIKCRDRVLATSMQQTQPTSAQLHFPDEIRMDGLTSDFKVTVEVYLLQASKEVLPHDVKYHISNKKSNSKLLTPKSKVSELKTPRVQSPAGPLSVRSPQFQLHGYCIFALSQANRKNFTLSKVPMGSPLEGSITTDIQARVRVPAPPPHAAFLTAFDDVSGLGAWHRRWFKLHAPRLAYWKYPDDVHKKMPIGDIDLSTVVSDKVTRAPRDLCARPNTILFETSVPAGLIVPDTGSLVYVKRNDGNVVRRHLLAADTAKDRDMWLDCLNQALEYVRCCSTDDE